MWLLSANEDDPILKSFVSESSRPNYAILSHTWLADEDEITFADVFDLGHTRGKPGWQKIEHTRIQARADGFAWVWIDTCCIDKTSSAELTEAINSMYKWYRNASKCYVYLADLHQEEWPTSEKFATNPDDYFRTWNKPDYSPQVWAELDNQLTSRREQVLRKCKWFWRGWTLQEMVAPKPSNIAFFTHEWHSIGTLEALQRVISRLSGVDEYLFRSKGSVRPQLRTYSVARRMSWAAKRVTTRLEDRAYALLGIFDVNIPIIYGEGTKSFQRLQHAIMQRYPDDHSLFVWNLPATLPLGTQCPPRASLLAPSPSSFQHSSDVIKALDAPSYGVSNAGIVFDTRIVEPSLAVLNCRIKDRMECFALAIEDSGAGLHEYTAKYLTTIDIYKTLSRASLETITIRFQPVERAMLQRFAEHRFPNKLLVRIKPPNEQQLGIYSVFPPLAWRGDGAYFEPTESLGRNDFRVGVVLVVEREGTTPTDDFQPVNNHRLLSRTKSSWTGRRVASFPPSLIPFNTSTEEGRTRKTVPPRSYVLDLAASRAPSHLYNRVVEPLDKSADDPQALMLLSVNHANIEDVPETLASIKTNEADFRQCLTGPCEESIQVSHTQDLVASIQAIPLFGELTYLLELSLAPRVVITEPIIFPQVYEGQRSVSLERPAKPKRLPSEIDHPKFTRGFVDLKRSTSFHPDGS